MARLFVDPRRLGDEVLVLSGEDHRYLTRVLRLVLGDQVVLFDGLATEATGRIIRMGPRAMEIKIDSRRAAVAPDRPEVTLLQGLTKGDKLDLVVQKATELGVARIIPVATQRSVPRLLEQGGALRAAGRRARWQKIAREAARQSGRADVPEVEPITPYSQALLAAPSEAWKVLLWEGAREHRLRDLIPVERPRCVVIAVGPEGGFDDDEVAAARTAGFVVAGMGPRILRTETAALVALAVIGWQLGDLG